MPQGEAGSRSPVTTAQAMGSRSPAAIIAITAPRSAQIVAPNDAFSTFVPTKMRPFLVAIAAPTAYFEYGEYESFLTALASSTRTSRSFASMAFFFPAFIDALVDAFFDACFFELIARP
jgi:hypothetical protein